MDKKYTEYKELLLKDAELREQIDELPAGSIGKKTIGGRTYFYHRFYVNGKRKEKYIPAEEVEKFESKIKKRKELEAEHKKTANKLEKFADRVNKGFPYNLQGVTTIDGWGLRVSDSGTSYIKNSANGMGIIDNSGASHLSDNGVRYGFDNGLSYDLGTKNGYGGGYGASFVFDNAVRYCKSVFTGEALRIFANESAGYQKRECYNVLNDYVHGDVRDKVFILYGLRRTGKTTMMRQVIAELTEAEFTQAAFVQVTPSDDLAGLNATLKLLASQGYKYIFIDEVSLLADFIEGAAIFSDIFAASGLKIVLSGTDSLGFMLTQDSQLYDRCIMLHTTFIAYREFESLLGKRGIDEFIRYGGTLSLGGRHYNDASTFASLQNTDEYIDSSIAHNIQHSLKYYQDGDHFRSLRELYEQGELTNVINRVVENINHSFALDVLTRNFRSGVLAMSQRNLRADANSGSDVLDRIDVDGVTERLRKRLEILNEEERNVYLQEVHAAQIKEYLDLLDLTFDFDVVFLHDLTHKEQKTVVSQPGLRYSQTDALFSSLLEDAEFSDISLMERNYVLDRIRSEVCGRLIEDLVLLETKLAYPRKRIFKLQFAIGEFDMVVFDPNNASCEIFEVKHSQARTPQQYRYLVDGKKNEQTEFRYGDITGRYVLYRGENATETAHMSTEAGEQEITINYVNVEDYQRMLPSPWAM